MRRSLALVTITALLLAGLPAAVAAPNALASRRAVTAELAPSVEISPVPQDPAPNPTYTITDLGSFTPRAINNRGQIAGHFGASFTSAYIWQRGKFISLGRLGSGSQHLAYDINDSGEVVGTSADRAFIWKDENNNEASDPGEMRDIGTLGGFQAAAFGINNLGQVVGEAHTDPESSSRGRGHAFLWQDRNGDGDGISGAGFQPPSDPGEMRDLGTFGTDKPDSYDQPGSTAHAVNDEGQVAGFAYNDANQAHAFLWQNGALIDLVPGDRISVAQDVNNSGQVVGSISNEESGELFMWQNGAMTKIDVFPGCCGNSANAINELGQVVGTSAFRPFLWENGTTTDLNTLLPPNSGWNLIYAYDINDVGQIIGEGYLNGRFTSFLMTPQRNPLVFVHGISGSNLVDRPLRGAHGEELWLGPFSDRRRLSLFPEDNPSPFIEATDAMRYVKLGVVNVTPIYGPLLESLTDKGGYREYKVDGFPFRRTSAGCDTTQKPNSPNLFVFAYDWRKDNGENAQKLKDFVGCVQQFHPGQKIDVLTHSMGSLLARRYILDNPEDHRVRKLVTIGAPWLGAPKLLHVLETGEFIREHGIPIAAGPDLKRVMESLTAAHQLLASRAYFELGGAPMLVEEGWDLDGDGNANETYTFDDVKRFLDAKYPRTTPGSTADDFHSHSPGRGAQDDWRSDSTGAEYFHIYGVEAGNMTPSQVVAKTETVCDRDALGIRSCVPVNHLDLRFTAGDRTVPARSAGRRTGFGNYNAPDAEVFRFAVSDPDKNDSVEHTGLTSNPEVQNKVFEILRRPPVSTAQAPHPIGRVHENANKLTPHRETPKGAPSGVVFNRYGLAGQREPLAEIASNGMPRFLFGPRALPGVSARAAQTTDEQESSIPSYYLTVIGGSFVTVADSRGNSTAPVAGDIEGTVPGVQKYVAGEKVEIITLPTSTTTDYSVTFRGGGVPVAIKLLKGVNTETPSEAIRYQDILLPANTPAQLSVTRQGAVTLSFDEDGDGSFEKHVEPTAHLSGAAALDVTAPEVEVRDASGKLIIDAADAGSGIEQIYYSLDGRSYQPYTEPVTVTSSGPLAASAFAEDGAGNRSGIVTHTFSPAGDVTSPTTSASLSAAANAAGWHNSDVRVTFAAVDNPGGSGVRDITYRVNGAPASGNLAPGGSAALDVTSEGITEISFYATDNAGNVEPTRTLTIKLDKSAPAISGARSSPPNQHGWYNANLTVSFNCADAVSGIVSCPGPTTLRAEGASQFVIGEAVDQAGNRAAVTIGGINIDKSPPVVSLSATPSVIWPPNGRTVQVTLSARGSDATSGLSGVTYAVVDEYEMPLGIIGRNLSGHTAEWVEALGVEARRRGGDLDGRYYRVAATVVDAAGNGATTVVNIVVPHDVSTVRN